MNIYPQGPEDDDDPAAGRWLVAVAAVAALALLAFAAWSLPCR